MKAVFVGLMAFAILFSVDFSSACAQDTKEKSAEKRRESRKQRTRGKRRGGQRGNDNAPKIGDVAPVFTLKSLDGESETNIGSFRDEKPIVLFFGSYT